jgi:DNA-binding beta-propeller fold protein YncE
MRHLMTSVCLILTLAAAAASQSSFVNYESALVHPIVVSPDGTRLFVLNTPNGTLEVYSLANPDTPLLLRQITVGLEPVSLAARTNDEVWVVNNLSDSVSIVSVNAGRILATLHVKDEPYDVVFAGSPQRAFVSAAGSDQVRVFDAQTRAPLGSIDIFGKDPRALVADTTGTKVYCVVHRSGNGTTVINPALAPAPPVPLNPALPPAPQQGIIVSATDPAWAGAIGFTLPDFDVAEIDTSTLAVTRNFSGAGTTLFDAAVDPQTGDLFVVNTEARNLVRFEPVIKGHVIDSRITKITTGASPVVTPIDLNPLVNYSIFPDPTGLATALAEPTNVVFGQGKLYVAAQGSDRIGVLATTGSILSRIDLGSTSTLTKRGPRGLALHSSASRLYVLNRMSLSISVIDTAADAVIGEQALAFDPTPQVLKDGRKFLYDTRLSGNGTMSCASCHVDGDIDLVLWDLGDPSGSLAPTPLQPFPFSFLMPADFHPMKGPMLTQTLRGLDGMAPLHWRGDRAGLADFNGAFGSLLGGTPLNPPELALFTTFMAKIALPPNPNQNLDRTYPTTPANNNAAAGENVFLSMQVPSSFGIPLTCANCHNMPAGTSNMIISGTIISQAQPLKVPQLRNLYRRQGAGTSGARKTGVGFTHDGTSATVAAFLATPPFSPWPGNVKDDLETFVLAFDTGTAPVVGYQVTVDGANAAAPQTLADIALLESQAAAGNCDVWARGTIDGKQHGLLYVPASGLYVSDDPALGSFTWLGLQVMALGNQAALTFTGSAVGTGTRLGIDRDADGLLDSLDGLGAYGLPVGGAAGPLYLGGNREPKVGTADFALVASGAAAGQLGLIGVSPLPAAIPTNGLIAYVDFTQPGFLTLPLAADLHHLAALPAPLPSIPALAGFTVYAQAAFFDPSAPGSFTASNGLALTIQP